MSAAVAAIAATAAMTRLLAEPELVEADVNL